MTPQESIEKLREFCKLRAFCELYPDDCQKDKCEIYMAIEALSSQPEIKTDGDAISRQAAIESLTEYGNGRTVYIGVEEAIRRIEQLPSEQPEQRWIPCEEQLPEAGKDVMVCYDFKGHRSVLIGVLYGDETFHGYDDEYLTPEGRKYRKAVAWMPLPEPYRGEEK